MIEVELKFRVEDLPLIEKRLTAMEASAGPIESHQDLYFRHPCRDFVATREALRIRRVGITGDDASGQTELAKETRVTYKGPLLPGNIKARRELEWSLQPSDPDGHQLQELLGCLGFEAVTTVRKRRYSMSLVREQREVTIAMDDVENVGSFVEVEVIAVGEQDVGVAREIVSQLATELGLSDPEPRSYLSMVLAKTCG